MRTTISLAMVALVLGIICIAERIAYEMACKANVNWQCYGVKR